MHVFFVIFCVYVPFFPFVMKKDGKSCFSAEIMIFISKHGTEHPFACQNTQHKAVQICWSLVRYFDSRNFNNTYLNNFNKITKI